jgi:hypothetical protein
MTRLTRGALGIICLVMSSGRAPAAPSHQTGPGSPSVDQQHERVDRAARRLDRRLPGVRPPTAEAEGFRLSN